MDWSAVYDNHGEEEGRWEDHGETRSSRNAHRLLHRKMSLPFEPIAADVSTQYSPLVAYAFTVNYILGVGSLGIPYAFFRAGLAMSNLMIVLVTLISYMTVMWVSETVARAREAYVVSYINETTPLNESDAKAAELRYDDFPEVTQLCDRFLGKLGSRMYQLSLLGLMYGGLLGYSQVFVNSFLTQVTSIGGVEITSLHAALLFGSIVIPLSCSDLTEQIYVQLAMSIVRFGALLIMIVSASYAMYADPYDSGVDWASLSSDAATASPPFVSEYKLVDLSGFGVMFSTGVFSQLFQHSVPGLLAPLGTRNQVKSHAIFGSTLVTTMLFYIVLGSICSLYFGPKVASSINLNWADFTWGLAASASLLPLWVKIMSTIVVIFPALDTLSVYPLISVTLGDNMAAVVPHRWVSAFGGKPFWKLVCRFAASIPPLLVSVFVSDLSITLQFSGMSGIYVAFFAPALLQLYASREFPSSNVYSGAFSSVRYVYAVLVFGVLAFGVLLYQLTQQLVA
uniref:Amino acid transporter transmembrane domain-containing protein n=1 Tax=Globisporangium ultimum (strain ATCC 200006 / CBS 805.95 / DAOM BR144) TaxID=431595 RepID=K3W5Q5_GLOUD